MLLPSEECDISRKKNSLHTRLKVNSIILYHSLTLSGGGGAPRVVGEGGGGVGRWIGVQSVDGNAPIAKSALLLTLPGSDTSWLINICLAWQSSYQPFPGQVPHNYRLWLYSNYSVFIIAVPIMVFESGDGWHLSMIPEYLIKLVWCFIII